MDSLAARIGQAAITEIEGTWQRHVAARYAGQALRGRVALGRWGTIDGYPVLYLGQPRNSVVVEAYRHLVDPVEDYIAAALPPRVLVTCTVQVTEILDLRSAANRVALGLSTTTLASSTRDRVAYRQCQEIFRDRSSSWSAWDHRPCGHRTRLHLGSLSRSTSGPRAAIAGR